MLLLDIIYSTNVAYPMPPSLNQILVAREQNVHKINEGCTESGIFLVSLMHQLKITHQWPIAKTRQLVAGTHKNTDGCDCHLAIYIMDRRWTHRWVLLSTSCLD